MKMKLLIASIAALGTAGAMAQTVPEVTETEAFVVSGLSPHAFQVPRGSVMTGGIWDMFYSDNAPMVLQSDLGGGYPAQVIVEGRLPLDPTGIALAVESRSTSPNVHQTMALWDWSANSWVTLGSDMLGAWDNVQEYTALGDPLRFSEAGTGRMLALVAYRSVGPTYGFRWSAFVDQIYWTYSH